MTNTIIIDGQVFDLHHLEYDGGLAAYLNIHTEDEQKAVVDIYHKVLHHDKSTVQIANLHRTADVKSVVCSGERGEIGPNLKNYTAIERCKVLFDIEHDECQPVLLNHQL